MGNITRTCEVLYTQKKAQIPTFPQGEPELEDVLCGKPAEYLAFYKEDVEPSPYRDDQPVAICETCHDTDEDILLVCWPLA